MLQNSDPPPYSLKDPLSSDEKDAPTSVNGRSTVFSKSFRAVYRDLWAAVAFLVHLSAMIYLPFYLYSIVDLAKIDPKSIFAAILNEFKNIELVSLSAILGASVAGAVPLIFILFYFMKSYSSFFIKASIITYLAILGMLTLVTLSAGAILASILLGIVFLINSLFFWRSRHRIPLTALVIKTTLHTLGLYPGLIFVSLCQLALQFVYATFSLCAIVLIAAAASQQVLEHGTLLLMLLFCVFSLFWTSQILMNVLHVTVSGVFAGFYLTGGKYASPILQCLGRSLTTSFGSICFGSLIVAIIQTLRFIVRSLKDDKSVVGAISDCILGFLENLASYFNFFAYTELAIYGRSFISSAKDCWSLIKRSGVELIVNDLLSSVVLGLGMFVVTICGVLYGTLLVSVIMSKLTQNASEIYTGISTLIFLLSYAMFCEMIRSGVNTSIVCFCEEPEGIKNSHPELYSKYTEIVSGYHA